MKTGLVIFNSFSQGYFSKHWKDDLANRDFDCFYADPAMRAANFSKIKELLAQQSYRYLLITAGNIPLEYNQVCGLAGVTKILFLTDDDWQFYPFSRFFGQAFDWIITTYRDNIALYQSHGFNHIILSQWGFNENLFRPLSVPRDIDVSFIGGPHGDRVEMLRYLMESGVHIHLYGPGWNKLSEFRKYWKGYLSDEDMVTVMNRTKINLNPLRAGDRSTLQIKGRTFELAGCCAFQLTERNDQLFEFFEKDKEIITFESYDDLKDKVAHFLKNENERGDIASAAYRRAMKDHTWRKRLNDIFVEIEKSPEAISRRYELGGCKPKVNILYFAKKNSQLCPETLTSIENQDYDHFNVYLICGSEAPGFKGREFISFDSPRQAIEHLDGKYVAFISDGDVWAPEKLSFHVLALENRACEENGVSLNNFGLYLHEPENEIIYYQYTDATKIADQRCYIVSSSVVVETNLVRRFSQEFTLFIECGIMSIELQKRILTPKRYTYHIDMQYSLGKMNVRAFQSGLKAFYKTETEKVPFSSCWNWRIDRNRLFKKVLFSRRALDGFAALMVSLSLKKPTTLGWLWRALPISFN